jgi:hypothetical protein
MVAAIKGLNDVILKKLNMKILITFFFSAQEKDATA